MVTLEGTYSFDAPQDVVWEAVQDPHVLSQVLPGCERLEQVGENEYEGEINIRIGPVQGNFAGTVRLSDIQPPNSYTLELEGQGRPGYVKGAGSLRLESSGDGKTTLSYTGEAQLSGRIASVGQRLMDSSARSITRQGLESLDKQIQARMQPPPAPAISPSLAAPEAKPVSPPPAPPPPSTTEVGLNVAKDVATDLLSDFEKKYSSRDVAIFLAGCAAIVWMWRMLFGKGEK
jgi:uncharacterized protein